MPINRGKNKQKILENWEKKCWFIEKEDKFSKNQHSKTRKIEKKQTKISENWKENR